MKSAVVEVLILGAREYERRRIINWFQGVDQGFTYNPSQIIAHIRNLSEDDG